MKTNILDSSDLILKMLSLLTFNIPCNTKSIHENTALLLSNSNAKGLDTAAFIARLALLSRWSCINSDRLMGTQTDHIFWSAQLLLRNLPTRLYYGRNGRQDFPLQMDIPHYVIRVCRVPVKETTLLLLFIMHLSLREYALRDYTICSISMLPFWSVEKTATVHTSCFVINQLSICIAYIGQFTFHIHVKLLSWKFKWSEEPLKVYSSLPRQHRLNNHIRYTIHNCFKPSSWEQLHSNCPTRSLPTSAHFHRLPPPSKTLSVSRVLTQEVWHCLELGARSSQLAFKKSEDGNRFGPHVFSSNYILQNEAKNLLISKVEESAAFVINEYVLR